MEIVFLKDLIYKPVSGEWGEDGGEIQVLRTTNFTNDGVIDYSQVVLRSIDQKKVESKRLKPGDIIIEKSGGSPKQPVGRVVFFDSQELFLCNNFTSVLRPKVESVYPKYLLYILFSNHQFGFTGGFQNKTTGIINLKLTRYIDETKIPLPPLEQQKKIATILDTADAYRQKTKALIDKYDELTQSLFLDMFGDPVTNPKGWEKVSLNQLCSFKKKSIKPEDIQDGETYLGLECIEKKTGVIVEKFIVKAGEVKSNKFWFNHEYILYGKLRPYLNKVANPDFEGICSTDIIPIKPLVDKSSKEFIISLMRGSWFVAFADERCSGANLPRISPKEVEKYQTINPPLELQNQFAERVKAIEAQKAQAQASLSQADNLFNSLLQKAFKGELVS